MKRMFRIQRMFHKAAMPAILAGALLFSSLPAAAAGGNGRSSADGSESHWMGFLAEVSAWLGGRLDAGISSLWDTAGSSFDPNGGTATTYGDDGSSIDPDGRR